MKRTISLSINDFMNKSWHFEDLKSFYVFAQGQVKYWEKASGEFTNPQNQNHQLISSYNNFRQVINSIDGWKDALENWDDDQLNYQLDQLRRNHFPNISQNWLWSGHSFVGAFLECNKSYGIQAATSFITFIIKGQINNPNRKEDFIGIMLAYEYELQDSDLTKRRNSEKVSLGHLRSQLDEATQKLTGEAEQYKANWQEWIESTATEHDTQQEKQKNQHDEQQTNQKKEFISYMDGCRTRIADLENTYQEKLQLEKPAEYWKKSARKYGFQGWLWSLALIVSILLGLVYFFDFFNLWLKGQELAVNLHTLQGAVIFGSILAVYAFLLKTISKLTFSSFHLMRDSEEREQLTYLYLSLNNEGQIDESSRDLILQALFSRTETGLLNGGSSPTMPVHDLLKTVLKTK